MKTNKTYRTLALIDRLMGLPFGLPDEEFQRLGRAWQERWADTHPATIAWAPGEAPREPRASDFRTATWPYEPPVAADFSALADALRRAKAKP